MSSLLDVALVLAKRPGAVCGIALLARRLDETELDELNEALAADVSAAAVSKALEARGYDVNYQSISRHRAGRCRCDVTR